MQIYSGDEYLCSVILFHGTSLIEISIWPLIFRVIISKLEIMPNRKDI
jgi:hypothetical protein